MQCHTASQARPQYKLSAPSKSPLFRCHPHPKAAESYGDFFELSLNWHLLTEASVAPYAMLQPIGLRTQWWKRSHALKASQGETNWKSMGARIIFCAHKFMRNMLISLAYCFNVVWWLARGCLLEGSSCQNKNKNGLFMRIGRHLYSLCRVEVFSIRTLEQVEGRRVVLVGRPKMSNVFA